MSHTVTPPLKPRTNPGMSLVGYLLAAGVGLLLLPILPLLVVLWLLSNRRTEERPGRTRRA